MNEESRAFIEQFSSMDTQLLLARHRIGGLVPEAQTALAEVLRRRGVTDEELTALAANAPSAASIVEAPPQAHDRAPAQRIKYSHPRLRGFRIALWCIVLPVIALFVVLATPLLGGFVVMGVARMLGCNTGENAEHPCHLLGWDIGHLVSGYTISAFLGGAAAPIIAGFAFNAFIRSPFGVAWLACIGGVLTAMQVARHHLRKADISGSA